MPAAPPSPSRIVDRGELDALDARRRMLNPLINHEEANDEANKPWFAVLDPASPRLLAWTCAVILLGAYSILATGFPLAFPAAHATGAMVAGWLIDVAFIA